MTATNYIPQNPSSVETPTTGPETFPQAADPFAKLGEPLCTGLTPENAEGPYYKAGSPERNSLLGEGLVGDRMILIGYVLDSDCTPIPKAWLDFWQADSNGNYDNSGFILRGHQYTDEQGRYLLETVLPGLYASRPIQHIHVKVQAPGGGILTTQLYFPDQAVQGLTVQVESMEKYQLVIFNFVLDQ
ncbi:MAG: hypothetical protein FJZ87_08510 [Chloroflexi bacterium]|nr:hypothetical protein [Chloroflexota bacterium]